MTIENYSSKNAAKLCQMTLSNYESQIWTLQDAGNGYYYIVNKFSGKVLNVPEASTEQGTVIEQTEKKDVDSQKWKFEVTKDGYYRITPKLAQNQALDVSGASGNDGASILQWNYGGADNQKWQLVAVEQIISNPVTEEPSVEQYTVRFDLNDGSAAASEIVEKGQKVKEPAIPTRDGYIFKGWYLGETKYNFETEVSSDITLTAKWEIAENNIGGNEETTEQPDGGQNATTEQPGGDQNATTEQPTGNQTTNETKDCIPVEVATELITSNKTDKDTKDSTYAGLTLSVKQVKKNSIKIKWKKVADADGYLVFANKCGKQLLLQKDITKGTTTSWQHKGLKKGTYYKYVVLAYKNVNDEKVAVSTSKTIHVSTTGGNYTDIKSIKVNKKSVTLKKNKTFRLKANEVKIKKSKRIKRHRKLSYESTNTKIATVSKSGTIKAKSKGKCYVYVYAQNGMYKKIKVTVK